MGRFFNFDKDYKKREDRPIAPDLFAETAFLFEHRDRINKAGPIQKSVLRSLLIKKTACRLRKSYRPPAVLHYTPQPTVSLPDHHVG